MQLQAYRLRILFRSAFALLALATLALALFVLREEKQLSYRNYAEAFAKNGARIAAQLRHPSGQLALLNPPSPNEPAPDEPSPNESAATENSGAQSASARPPAALHPLLLPYAALDFDDQSKVQQAIEMSGCEVQYGADTHLCVAIGSNPWAGGYIYLAGGFSSSTLIPHRYGNSDLTDAHRAQVRVRLRGVEYRWTAVYELNATPRPGASSSGRLTGFIDDGSERASRKPIKDFRGWLWQSGSCQDPGLTAVASLTTVDCPRRAFYSIRLPIDLLSAELVPHTQPEWPPPDLRQIDVSLRLLPPGDGPPLFDTLTADAQPPFSLNDLRSLLQPGEHLRLRAHGKPEAAPIVDFIGIRPKAPAARWISAIIRRLPIDNPISQDDAPIELHEAIATPLGSYDLQLSSDIGSVNRTLGIVATRVSWLVGGLLLAILLTWLAIEIGIIRRIAQLTQRAEALSRKLKASAPNEPMDLTGVRSNELKSNGGDELDILARGLSDLLRRVQEDAQRERLRAEREKDQWHAVGHEIMSPLQSLMALHGTAEDPSHRYIQRMQQAIRVLYGQASPSEAFQSTSLAVDSLDLDQFLHHVAANAHCVGIEAVDYQGPGIPVPVRASDYALEDVVTHVLRNAQRYRTPDSPIRIRLSLIDSLAAITLHNQGPAIPGSLLDKIFEYGVSDGAPQASDTGTGTGTESAPTTESHRGQGLFVAKTYMAKMGGTITARNCEDGVEFRLELPRLSS